MQIPEQFKDLFWDTDFSKIDAAKDKWFVIESVVNNGSVNAAKWLFASYSKSDIIHVLKSNYNISTKAIAIWGTMMGINPQDCRCNLRPSALRVFD